MPFYNVKNIAIETGISVLREATAKNVRRLGRSRVPGPFASGDTFALNILVSLVAPLFIPEVIFRVGKVFLVAVIVIAVRPA